VVIFNREVKEGTDLETAGVGGLIGHRTLSVPGN
jgi:hypothetical protein